MDTLYYDGKCHLCSREILFLKKHAKNLAFIDIHSLNEEHIPNKELLLKILHLKTKNGDWLSGVDATVRSWQHTPYGFLIKFIQWPIIHIFTKKIYAYWAKKRYCKLYK